MSKTFREDYYEDENRGRNKNSYKQKRQKVKNFLKRIDINSIDPDDEDLEELNDEEPK